MAVETESAPAAAESQAGTEAPEAAVAPKGLADAISELRSSEGAWGEEEPAEKPASDEVEKQEEAPADDDKPVEGEGEELEVEGKEEEEADEEDEEEEVEEPKEGDAYVVKLPGRGAEDQDLEVELDGLTKPQIEAFNRLRKGYMRREQYNAEAKKIESERTELDEIHSSLAADPAGFIRAQVKNPKIKEQVAKDFLVELLDSDTDEAQEQYDNLMAELADLERDPVKRENYRLKRDRTPPAKAAASRNGPSDPEVEKVVTAVRGQVPAGTPQAEAIAFVEDSLRAIQRHLVTNKLDSITPKEVETITARYRRAHGFESSAGGKKGGAAPLEEEKSPTATQKAPAGKDPKETGKRLAKASARRREATTTPAGAGAPSIATPGVPKGGGIKEAINALKENLK